MKGFWTGEFKGVINATICTEFHRGQHTSFTLIFDWGYVVIFTMYWELEIFEEILDLIKSVISLHLHHLMWFFFSFSLLPLFLIFFLVTPFHLHVFFSTLLSLLSLSFLLMLFLFLLCFSAFPFSPFLFSLVILPSHPPCFFTPSFLSPLSSLLSHLLYALSLYLSLAPILQPSFPCYFFCLSPFLFTSISVYSFTMRPVSFDFLFTFFFWICFSLQFPFLPSFSHFYPLSSSFGLFVSWFLFSSIFFHLLLPLPILCFFSLVLLSSPSIFPLVEKEHVMLSYFLPFWHTNTIVLWSNSSRLILEWNINY